MGGTVVVTGASGFVGARLCPRLLDEGWQVVALRRDAPTDGEEGVEGLDWVAVDLRDRIDPALLRGRVDALVHLAADRGRNDAGEGALAREVAINVLAPSQLYDWAWQRGVQVVVHLSSATVYRLGPHDGPPYAEDAPLVDVEGHPYALTKCWGEQVAQRLAARGCRVSILRPSNIYGPGEPARTLVGQLRGLLRRGEPVTLPGSDGHRYSPVHVDDVVAAILWALAAREGHLVNVGGPSLSQRVIALELARRMGCEAIFDPRPDLPAWSFVPSSARLDRLWPSRPRTPWPEGLERRP